MDFLDYDVDPDVWIRRLLRQIAEGRYEPAAPARFTLGKSLGLSRTMTLPSVSDLVLYRAIADLVYRRARRYEKKNVYFRRDALDAARKAAEDEAGRVMEDAAEDYRKGSRSRFLTWLRYNQYRKLLLQKKLSPYLVITDITNFFDSVLHSHVAEALRRLSLPPRMVGLLFFLLERSSIRHDYEDSHHIGLPVDEFDCSRTLAHLVLFDHDERMVELTDADRYVRWMDDQTIGVQSYSHGLRVLGEVGRSLSRLHLTPNAKKSRILSLREARRHFHLDLNDALDQADELKKRLPTRRAALAKLLRRIWRQANHHEGVGEFRKILSRMYRLAGLAGARFLRHRAVKDVLKDPDLAVRVCDYMRCCGTTSEYLTFVGKLLQHPQQVYPDVSVAVLESLLRVEAVADDARTIRRLASDSLAGKLRIPGAAECMAVAPLLLLRFGDRRSLPLLRRTLQEEYIAGHTPVVRSIAFVCASYGVDEFHAVRRVASKLLRSPLPEMVRLVERVQQYDVVPDRYKGRLELRFDAVAGCDYVDMRTLLTARLLLLSKKATIKVWVMNWKRDKLARNISDYDRSLIQRLVR